MIQEIGSEFFQKSNRKKELFLSGRTALEFIIRDILKQYDIESVCLPSYCCHTMIEPFVRHNIKVRFYDVYFDPNCGIQFDIPQYREKEIFYYMEYFGYSSNNDMSEIRENYVVIINDKTHSWLSNSKFTEENYSYISYRKWNWFSGISEAYKNNGNFEININNVENNEYIGLRENAASIKRKYMAGESINKIEFLNIYNEAEELLENDYINYRPSYDAICSFINTDWNEITNIRKRNAKILTDGIKKIKQIDLIYTVVQDDDVPLFVPIYVKDGRDELKKYLIKKDIYCPVHWPLSDIHNISDRAKELYNCELSLVCDQRYDIEDMKRMVLAIEEYFE